MDGTVSLFSRSYPSVDKRSHVSFPALTLLAGRPQHWAPSVQNGILVVNQEGRILYLNGAAQKLLDAFGQKQVSDFLNKVPRTPAQAQTNRIFVGHGRFYRAKSIPLKPYGNTGVDPYFFLILIQRVFYQAPGIDFLDPSARFTEQERRIAALLSIGWEDREMARFMGVSEYALKGYIRKVLRKLNIKSRSDVVAKLYRVGTPPR